MNINAVFVFVFTFVCAIFAYFVLFDSISVLLFDKDLDIPFMARFAIKFSGMFASCILCLVHLLCFALFDYSNKGNKDEL